MPLMSVVAHAFACQSKRSWDLLWRLDYAAILILWFGGKVIYEGYFAFFCTPTLYYLWLGIALPVFLVLGYQFVVQDNYNSVCMLYLFMHVPNFFMSRVLADMSHAALLERAAMEELEEGLSWCWVGSACGVVGFMVFITRVPERWFPGYFTCWGISHQWWHVFVTLGPLCCLKAGRHFVHYTSMAHCSSSSSTTGYA
jgi:predicted membrane channel-forming protein YqfA (hemolysin III family)